MPTIDEVARRAGVSISTVSYALSGKRSLTTDTRNRVLEAARELGYVPNARARMLAANRSHILAVTAPLHVDTETAAHMTFALEVTRAARAHGYDTLLLVDDDAVVGMRRTASAALSDGIVVLDVDIDDARADLARTLGHPVVFIGIPADTKGLMCVDLDFEAAARMAIDKLVAQGHRSIGLISHEHVTVDRGSNFPLRFLRGFTEHAAKVGIDVAVTHPGDDLAEGTLDDLLTQLPTMTGLVLNTSEEVTQGVVPGLAARGREVPRDVSIIAAGVTSTGGRAGAQFDTIPIDPRASCWTAVQMLNEAIESGTSTPMTILLEPQYIEKGTVVAPR